MTTPKRGTTFRHAYYLNPTTSGKALCRVTAVRSGQVYYNYATNPSNKAAFKVPLETWIERYGNETS